MRSSSFAEGVRSFLTSRRFLWAVTIAFGLVVVLYLLFVSFFFNPFEDDLEDTAAIVPQDVDYFLRWKSPQAFFGAGFPVPRFWEDFARSPIYAELQQDGQIERWGQDWGVARALADLEAATGNLPAGLEVTRDLLREVALAGNGKPELGPSFDGLLMLRVSGKIKLGVALLDFGFVRGKLPEEFLIESLGEGRYRLPQFPAFGYQDAYLTRMRDVVLVGTKPEWLDRARELEIRSGEDSLATASRFNDNVQAYLAPGDQPVEVFLRWDDLAPLLGDWPQPENAVSFGSRLPGRFFTTKILRYLSGYFLFEDRAAGGKPPDWRFQARLAGETDPSKAGEFQRAWYESQSLTPAKIRDFAELIPGDSFFYGAFAGDVGRLTGELLACLDDDLRRLLEDTVVNAGTYQGTVQLLEDVSNALAPGAFVGLRRFEYEASEKRDTPHDDAPMPVFVIVGTLRNKEAFDRLLRYVDQQFRAGRLGVDAADAKVQRVGIYGGLSVDAFASMAIPGTGEFVVMQFPARNAVLISNSYRYMEQVVKTAFSTDRMVDPDMAPPLARLERFEEAMATLERTHTNAKAFLYFDPSEARHWFDRLAAGLAEQRFQEERELAWSRGERAAEERRQRERMFPGAAELSMEQENQLKDAVDQALLAARDQLGGQRLPQLRAELARGFLPLQMLDWLCCTFQANRKDAALQLSGRLQLD